jgi:uncharacterized protein
MYKTSHYNVYVPIVETNNYLIYKTTTGALSELTWQEGQLIERWAKLSKISKNDFDRYSDFISNLYNIGFLVDENIDEIEEAHQFYLKRRKRQYYNKAPNFGLTIAPTLDCNMRCKYCYSVNKRSQPMTIDNVNAIVNILEKELRENKDKFELYEKNISLGAKSIFVTWVGGEPTIEKSIIKSLSEKFIKITSQYNLEYSAQIITNGILLDSEWIKLLREIKVERIQITLDGGRETHNKSRPLGDLQNPEENYDKILENIQQIPESIHLTIRINSDRNIFQNIEPLFNDLEERGIWPQHAKNINLGIAPKRTFDIIGTCIDKSDDTSMYFKDYNDFYGYVDIFKKLKLEHYNRWAEKVGKVKMKRKWTFPRFWLDDCALSVSPYGLAFSSDGYIYKCWEHLDKTEYRVQSVYDRLDVGSQAHKEWLSYDRFRTFKKCETCKYILRCYVVYCGQNKFKEEEPPCSDIKSNFKNFLKNQYLQSINNNEEMETIEEYLERSKAKPDLR